LVRPWDIMVGGHAPTARALTGRLSSQFFHTQIR
jgi:hypothetical protein